MPSEETKIAVIENELVNVTKSIDALRLEIGKIALTLENLRTTFVPRTEHDQLSIVIRGVGGVGGLVKEVEKLDNKVNKYIIIIGIAWFLFSAGVIAGWQYFLTGVNRTTNTTNNTTNNK